MIANPMRRCHESLPGRPGAGARDQTVTGCPGFAIHAGFARESRREQGPMERSMRLDGIGRFRARRLSLGDFPGAAGELKSPPGVRLLDLTTPIAIVSARILSSRLGICSKSALGCLLLTSLVTSWFPKDHSRPPNPWSWKT